jgi:hypothetical protein
LRKYEKALVSGKNPGQKSLLKKLTEYQKSPREAFTSEEPDDLILVGILMGLKDAISEGKLGLDKKEGKKTLAKIEQWNKDQLREALLKLIDLKKKQKNLKQKILDSEVKKQRDELIKRID